MRIFRYWCTAETVVQVAGQPQRVRCHGGSNVSVADAVADARRSVAAVVARISGEQPNRADYEVDIREEIVARLDARNIVTRNRYGAEILNSENVMFVDIDRPPRRWWEILFGVRASARKQERIVDLVRRRAAEPGQRGLGFRVYATHSGVRVIVSGRAFDPKGGEARQLMRRLNADVLYAQLCRRQGCFRARLTPKPSRMKYRTPRIAFPRADEAQENAFRAWIEGYDRLRRPFATCRFLGEIGAGAGGAVIDHHDRVTGARGNLPLA